MIHRNSIIYYLGMGMVGILVFAFIAFPKQPVVTEASEELRYKEGEVLVEYEDGDVDVVHLYNYQDEKEFAERLESVDSVKNASPNYLYKLNLVPNDSLLYKQWYLGQVHTYLTWNTDVGSSDVTVAVIDSGIQISHPDLRNNIWNNVDEIDGNNRDDDGNGYVDDKHGYDFIRNLPDVDPKYDFLVGPTDDNRIGLIHGTAVASVIAAQGDNMEGTVGVSWKSKLMSLRVADSEGFVDGLSVIRAVDYAIANDADIINLSFGGIDSNPILDETLLRAYRAGLVVVVSAGNQDGNGQQNLDINPVYPACTLADINENILIGVGASTKDDQLASFSHYGSRCVDILAPGVDFTTAKAVFPSLDLNQLYGSGFSGTSMAAPVVSGAAALLKSIHPEWTNQEIIASLLLNADSVDAVNPSFAGRLGRGRLNILASAGFDERKIILRQTTFSAEDSFLFFPETRAKSRVNIMESDWSESNAFAAYPFVFEGGVYAVSGDITGNGQKEIITAPGKGGGPQIRIFDNRGNLKGQFFAYDPTFRGGITMTLVDRDGNGIYEILTIPGSGSTTPIVRIFNLKGEILEEFHMEGIIDNPGYDVAAADVDKDGKFEIITIPQNGLAMVRIFDLDGNKEGQFLAYPEFYKQGGKVAVGDINNDGDFEIITGTNRGGGPQVRIFKPNGSVVSQFFVGEVDSRDGITVGILKVETKTHLLVGSGKDGAGWIELRDFKGKSIRERLTLGTEFNYGVRIGKSF